MAEPSPAPPAAPAAKRTLSPHVTPDYYLRGRRWLLTRDPKLAAIIKRAGPCRMRAYQDGEPLSALVETIVSQQLSSRVADVIFGRHGLRKPPSLKRLDRMGEVWRPYRSLAAWYLWASLSHTEE